MMHAHNEQNELKKLLVLFIEIALIFLVIYVLPTNEHTDKKILSNFLETPDTMEMFLSPHCM
jgi:hypothetical protein